MPADKFASAPVLQMPKIARRAKFCQLAAYYPDLLATIMAVTKINDGTEGPKGEPMVRDMDSSERRAAAVLTAMQFFTVLFHIRAKFEEANAGQEDRAGLREFSDACMARCVAYSADRLNSFPISVEPDAGKMLKDAEAAFVDNIFGALRAEMFSNTLTDETDFWRDVILGFGDADPSGVVGDAGRMLLLHHIDELRAAITRDTVAAEAVTRH